MDVTLMNPYYFGAETLARVFVMNMTLSECRVNVTVDSRFDCAMLCWKDVDCGVFSYNQLSKMCCLSEFDDSDGDSSDEVDVEEDLDSEMGTHTYKITAARKRCPGGFTWYNDGQLCYKFQLPVVPWETAKDACGQHEARLLHLDTQKKNDEIYDVIKSKEEYNLTSFYIGAKYDSEESSWRWTDESRVEYTDWQPYQPDGTGDCTALLKDFDHKWDDLPCDNYMSYICEIPQ